MRRALLAMALLTGLLSVAPGASAQQDARSSTMARRLFRQGVQLAEQEQFDQAVERFRRAYRLRAAPPIAFNLARSLVELGQLVEAAELLRGVQRDVESGAVREMADTLLEAVQPRIAELTIMVEGDTQGVEISVDGEVLVAEALGIAAPMDPGRHRVEASRDGVALTGETVEVTEGAQQEVVLVVPVAPSSVLDASGPIDEQDGELLVEDGSADSSGGVFSQWWFWTTVGLVLAGAAVAAVLILGAGPESPVNGNSMPGVITWD